MNLKRKNLNNEKGITLIALVITIIVMLILVAVTIRVATDGNLFTHAANAVKGTKTAIEGENGILNDDLGIEAIVAAQTGEGGAAGSSVTNPFPENTWAKAWTYSSTDLWSNEITDNSEELTGDIAAKAYTVTGGYHLVIEKIGSSGEMGFLIYASVNTSKKIAKYTPYINDSLKLAISPAVPMTPHAWQQTDIKNQIVALTICDGVTSIADSAFDGCSSLVSATIPISVTSIPEYAFTGCTSLTSITIPSSVTSIGSYAFTGCTSLTSITIPSGVTSIGSRAFNDCTSLRGITIPSSVTSIGEYAFNGCTLQINYLGTISDWNSITKGKQRIRKYYSSLYKWKYHIYRGRAKS